MQQIKRLAPKAAQDPQDLGQCYLKKGYGEKKSCSMNSVPEHDYPEMVTNWVKLVS